MLCQLDYTDLYMTFSALLQVLLMMPKAFLWLFLLFLARNSMNEVIWLLAQSKINLMEYKNYYYPVCTHFFLDLGFHRIEHSD